jgi:hypothetical protein
MRINLIFIFIEAVRGCVPASGEKFMGLINMSPEMAVSLTGLLSGILDSTTEKQVQKITIEEVVHVFISTEIKQTDLLKVTVYLKPYTDGVTD